VAGRSAVAVVGGTLHQPGRVTKKTVRWSRDGRGGPLFTEEHTCLPAPRRTGPPGTGEGSAGRHTVPGPVDSGAGPGDVPGTLRSAAATRHRGGGPDPVGRARCAGASPCPNGPGWEAGFGFVGFRATPTCAIKIGPEQRTGELNTRVSLRKNSGPGIARWKPLQSCPFVRRREAAAAVQKAGWLGPAVPPGAGPRSKPTPSTGRG